MFETQAKNKEIHSILVRFLEYELEPHQIQDFKTKINRILGGKLEAFHNHRGSGEQTKLEYPTIQYRSVKTLMQNEVGHQKNFNLAGLFGINKGVEAILYLLHQITKNQNPKSLFHFEVEKFQTEIKMTALPLKYKINHWLPLNETSKKIDGQFIKIDNYKLWKSEMPMKKRVEFLEGLITGQLLEFCEEMGFRIPEKSLKVSLYDYRTLGKVKYPNNDNSDIHFEAFDVVYEANLLLPEYIGLGKGKSKGFGWQTQTKIHQLFDKKTTSAQTKNRTKTKEYTN